MHGNRFWYGLLAVVLAAAAPSSAQSVVITDLGLPVGDNCWANDINNAAQIVGHCRPAGDSDPRTTRGFVWNGTVNYLSTWDGVETRAKKINAVGQVIGSTRVQGEDGFWRVYGVFWDKERRFYEIKTQFGRVSSAEAINILGQVVGWAYQCQNDCIHPFVWEKEWTGPLLLGTYLYREAHGINGAGTIVGVDTWLGRSLLWTKGEAGYGDPTDLLGADPRSSRVLQINELGQVLGLVWGSDGIYKLYVWDKGAVTILPFPDATYAHGVLNNLGQVAATIVHNVKGVVVRSIFLWDSGNVTNLGFDCYWGSVADINDYSQIAATCTGSPSRGAVWERGKWTDLGSLGTSGSLTAMNDVGQITGQRSFADGTIRATLWSIPASPLVSLPAVDGVISTVNQLVAGSQMDGAEGAALIRQLEVVKNALSEYRTEAACRLLQAIRREIEAKVRAGRVSAADGQQVVDAIERVSACAG